MLDERIKQRKIASRGYDPPNSDGTTKIVDRKDTKPAFEEFPMLDYPKKRKRNDDTDQMIN